MTRERQSAGIRLLMVFGVLLALAAICWLVLGAVQRAKEKSAAEREAAAVAAAAAAEEEAVAETEEEAEEVYTGAVYVNDDGVEFPVEYGTSRSTEIDAGIFSDPYVKNNVDLAAWAEMAWENQCLCMGRLRRDTDRSGVCG
ncbi:MAG: hypothetical protein LUE21_10650 [Oscillospiraceae bacterium]|nr:hypothetical protein [Oscillospiraceae bacterium]